MCVPLVRCVHLNTCLHLSEDLLSNDPSHQWGEPKQQDFHVGINSIKYHTFNGPERTVHTPYSYGQF